jgi:hypothetical protein
MTDDWYGDELLREKWMSPTCLLHHPGRDLVYVGLTALNGDIFYAFDPRKETWESLQYPAQRDRYANKIHQSLELDGEGRIYGAVATLSDVDAWPKLPGGQIFRYDPKGRTYEFLGIPVEHDYIQAILLDRKRAILYGTTFPGRKFFRYDIETRRARLLTMLGNVSTEHMALDAEGGVWHNYELAQWAERFPLFRYDPDKDKITFYNLDLPDVNPGKPGSNQIDTALRTRDGSLYVGTAAGALVQLDPSGPRAHYLGKPLPFPRMKGLVEGPGASVVGVGGTGYETHLFSFDPGSRRFEDLGPIEDEIKGARCWKPHHLCRAGVRTLLVAECDNPQRGGFLFRVELEA